MYLFSEDLAVIPSAKEEKVATMIHVISGSDHTVYLERPLEGEAFCFRDSDGVDLHGPQEFRTHRGLATVARHIVGKLHRAK